MRLALAALILAAAACPVHADPIQARQDGFKAFKTAFGGMKKMLDGKLAFDAARFQALAADLSKASTAQWQALDRNFPKGSTEGETEALPAIWEQWAGFKAAADKNHAAIEALAEAARSGDQARLKPAFGAVGSSCKGCHENFKGD